MNKEYAREWLVKQAKEIEEEKKLDKVYPLRKYSTSELKEELRRRKSNNFEKY